MINLYGVYDVKAHAVQPQLFSFENHDVAKRQFAMILDGLADRYGLTIVARYPDDFYLVQVGAFDQNGEGIVTGVNDRVCCMADLMPKHEG